MCQHATPGCYAGLLTQSHLFDDSADTGWMVGLTARPAPVDPCQCVLLSHTTVHRSFNDTAQCTPSTPSSPNRLVLVICPQHCLLACCLMPKASISCLIQGQSNSPGSSTLTTIAGSQTPAQGQFAQHHFQHSTLLTWMELEIKN